MIIMYKWLYYWWEQVIMYKYLKRFLSKNFNLILVSIKFLFHYIRIHYFNNRIQIFFLI